MCECVFMEECDLRGGPAMLNAALIGVQEWNKLGADFFFYCATFFLPIS